MQRIDDTTRLENNPFPQWEVPVEVIDTVIDTKEECSKALSELGLGAIGWSGSHLSIPSGCSYRKGTPHFNTNAAGKGRDDLAPICKKR